MRAVVHDRYGPPQVLHLEDVPRPVPKDDEVLVKIHATTVNRTDCHARAGEPFVARFISGLRRPRWRILGTEFAGEVEAVGTGVREFAVGDHVFGLNPWRFGTHAEYVCVPESAPLAHKPAGMTFEEAAAVGDGGLLALMNLRRAGLRKGWRVLIYGASGSIGTAAVQLAKWHAAHVTAVCTTKNFEIVTALGADKVVDYTQEDFTTNGQTYDVILDGAGMLSFTRCRGSLKPHGVFIPTDGWRNLARGMSRLPSRGRRVVLELPPRYTKHDLLFLKKLIDAGKYRAVIDRRYPLEQVIDAATYVETRQKTGNVVLTVAGERES